MISPFEIKRYLPNSGFRVYVLMRILRCTVTNVENSDTSCRSVASEKDYEHELPATRDRRSGSPGSGFVSERDQGGPSAARHPGDLERGNGRSPRAHAPPKPIQHRPRRRPLYRGADAGRHGRL